MSDTRKLIWLNKIQLTLMFIIFLKDLFLQILFTLPTVYFIIASIGLISGLFDVSFMLELKHMLPMIALIGFQSPLQTPGNLKAIFNGFSFSKQQLEFANKTLIQLLDMEQKKTTSFYDFRLAIADFISPNEISSKRKTTPLSEDMKEQIAQAASDLNKES